MPEQAIVRQLTPEQKKEAQDWYKENASVLMGMLSRVFDDPYPALEDELCHVYLKLKYGIS